MKDQLKQFKAETSHQQELYSQAAKELETSKQKSTSLEKQLQKAEEEISMQVSRLNRNEEDMKKLQQENFSLNEHKKYQRLYMANLISSSNLREQTAAW
mmetsp:Transcript_1452/g.1869  ORF Transcript_1452/g.1869 Transcript_1452/m.1869 type:complete len:99 (-) Transcript_1452:649-945(-)